MKTGSVLPKNIGKQITEVEGTNDSLHHFCLEWISRIKSDKDFLNADAVEAMKFYESDPAIVKVIDGRSKVTTTDMFDAVEAAKAFLLEIFAGGEDICSLEPVTEDDVRGVENMGLLINKQMRDKNPWFLICHDTLDELLRLRFGAIKCTWERTEEVVEKEYIDMDLPTYQAKKEELINKGVEILAETKNVKTEAGFDVGLGIEIPEIASYNIVAGFKSFDETARIQAVPSEECGFPITTKDESTCPFFYHRVRYTEWEFRDEFGDDSFKLVEEITTDTEGSIFSDSLTTERFKDLGGLDFFYNKENKQWLVYECYFRHPKTGKLWIYTFCGDVELRSLKNKYGRLPFRFGTAFRVAYRMIGKGYFHILKQIMKMRTAMFRQVFDNTYQANFRRYFGDPTRVDTIALRNNTATQSFVATMGDPTTALMPEQKAPLPPEVFSFLEMLNVEKDYHSKVPRSFQGVNKNVLNKTFRGQNQQIGQASQGLLLMARLIAEMLFRPLIQDVMDLNVRFLQKRTSVRYLNEFVEIDPDNIVSKADVIVNVGLGTGSKDNLIAKLQQLIGLMGQAMKGGASFITQQNLYIAYKELVKAMEFKNISDFVTDPKLKETFTQLVQTLVGMLIQMGIKSPAQLPPQLMQGLGQVCTLLGVNLPTIIQQAVAQNRPLVGPGVPGNGGSFPGQNMPERPVQPEQPMQERSALDGGQFFG